MTTSKVDLVMMKTAIEFASLSVAERKKVGCVITRNDRIVAVGYNGTLPGIDNCCEIKVDCKKCDGYDNMGYDPACNNCNGTGKVLETSEFVMHAEQNALTFCNREGLSTQDCTIYVTMAPCKTCTKLLVSAGIKRVVYHEKYRDLDGLGFLKKFNIDVNQIKEI